MSHRRLPTATQAGILFADPGFRTGFFPFSKCSHLANRSTLNFRAEFFNIWNHVNPLFEPVGLIGEEPQPLEFGTPQFGFAQGARDPRFIQFAVKFYF